jgi:methylthioribose-1-phosphate isomerase
VLTARTIDWADGSIVLIDQTRLPHEEVVLTLTDVGELAEAIRALRVRGAPALGAAGALGVALAVHGAEASGADVAAAAGSAGALLAATRPTAVNLARGIELALRALPSGPTAVVAAAVGYLDEIDRVTHAIGARGADLLDELVGGGGLRLLTHCNAGALACVGWGTALGVVGEAHLRGRVHQVFTCETRPLLQGARLTAWELGRMGARYRVLVDGAAAGLVLRGEVDAVIVGADRIAANGDVANKVGTVAHALAAARAGIPFIVAAPEDTIDLHTPAGVDIPIEERSAEEVTSFDGRPTAPPGSEARNPAFDVTPADLVTAIVTERRVIRPGAGQRPDDPFL